MTTKKPLLTLDIDAAEKVMARLLDEHRGCLVEEFGYNEDLTKLVCIAGKLLLETRTPFMYLGWENEGRLRERLGLPRPNHRSADVAVFVPRPPTNFRNQVAVLETYMDRYKVVFLDDGACLATELPDDPETTQPLYSPSGHQVLLSLARRERILQIQVLRELAERHRALLWVVMTPQRFHLPEARTSGWSPSNYPELTVESIASLELLQHVTVDQDDRSRTRYEVACHKLPESLDPSQTSLSFDEVP